MKKFVNDPKQFVPEMLKGIALANPDTITYVPEYNLIMRSDAPSNDKVSIVQGSGSGHEPAHVMAVGPGMLDAACPGDVFAAPPADYVYQTAKLVASDKGVLLLLVGAPVLYGFFYPWFYADEVLTRVPVAVVDLDHTSLSRQITRFADAGPRIEVHLVTGSEREAQEALWRGEIEGYAVIPAGLKRNVVRGENAVVSIEANGAYALLNKTVQYGFAEAVGTVSAGVEIRKLQASGQSAPQARASRAPVQLQMVALFNPTEGYGSFVVPAVALLILQQTLLMGAAMLTGTWVESGQHRARAIRRGIIHQQELRVPQRLRAQRLQTRGQIPLRPIYRNDHRQRCSHRASPFCPSENE